MSQQCIVIITNHVSQAIFPSKVANLMRKIGILYKTNEAAFPSSELKTTKSPLPDKLAIISEIYKKNGSCCSWRSHCDTIVCTSFLCAFLKCRCILAFPTFLMRYPKMCTKIGGWKHSTKNVSNYLNDDKLQRVSSNNAHLRQTQD